jgi:hypothetical protein
MTSVCRDRYERRSSVSHLNPNRMRVRPEARLSIAWPESKRAVKADDLESESPNNSGCFAGEALTPVCLIEPVTQFPRFIPKLVHISTSDKPAITRQPFV